MSSNLEEIKGLWDHIEENLNLSTHQGEASSKKQRPEGC